MYSIPAYALRFAAHCRSRLKYLDDGARDAVRGSTAGASRLWIRFAPHERRANIAGKCTARRMQGATP